MLKVNNINAGYAGLEVIQGISVEVGEKEVVALVGSNGAGKSTVLRAISGILVPSKGSICFKGQDITGMPAHKIAAMGVAHVPEGKHLFTKLSVEDNLLLGAYLKKDPVFRAKTMKYIFDLFPRLHERRTQTSGTLSGGEQQMLAIGRALMMDPKLLLLDEPSLGIAPILVMDIFKAIQEISSSGLPILLLEQRLEQTLKISNRAYVLQTGKIIMQGKGAELLNSEEVRKVYLGVN